MRRHRHFKHAPLWLATGAVLLFCLAKPVAVRAQQEPPRSARAGAGDYRIAGVVVDAQSGLPVAGAELSISTADVDMKATSEENGKFVFQGLEAGKYPLTASAPGYVTESYNQHGAFTTAMVVGSGLDSEHMVFRLPRQGVITGTISDERGEAVRDAQVMLFIEERLAGKTSIRNVGRKQTDDLGAYRFAHLRAGKYFVAVSTRPWYAQTALKGQRQGSVRYSGPPPPEERWNLSSGQNYEALLDVVYATTFYPGVTDEHSAGELLVSAGETQQANIRLQAVPSIHITLANLPASQPNGQGVGISGMQKIFDSQTGMGVAMGEISPGVYELAGLPPGDVTLNVNASRNGESQIREIHVNPNDGDVVYGGESVAHTDVNGRVIPAVPVGQEGLQGTVFLNGSRGQALVRRLNKDGTFSIEGVEADTYTVHAMSNRGGEYADTVTATGAKVDGQEVQIDGSEPVQLVIHMSKELGRIKGMVKHDGKPQAGALVLLVPAAPGANLERDARMDQSDSDGTFALGAIRPGKYVLMAIEDGWDLEWKDQEALKPFRAKGQPVEIRGDDTKNLEVQEIRDWKREESSGEKEKESAKVKE